MQVFATTHSWDCIESFSKVSSYEENIGAGKYIRLDKKNGKIISVAYSQDELLTAVEKRIETR